MDDYNFFNNSLDNAENNPSTDPNAIEIPDENISDDFDFSTLTEPKDTDEEKELTEFSYEDKLDKTEPAYSFHRYYCYQKGQDSAKCRICKTAIKRTNGNTNGMEKHLKRHSKAYNEFTSAKNDKKSSQTKLQNKRLAANSPEDSAPKQKQVKITDYSSTKKVEKWSDQNPKSKRIDDLLLRFICLSCEPLNLTEKEGFSEIFHEACPRFSFLNFKI